MFFCFAVTLLLSAFLLFSLQPLCGRLVLPLLGGTPAVWTGCMLFFQATLLLGYLYAHGVARLPLRCQAMFQLLLAVVSLAFLPIALPPLVPRPGDAPLPWLLEALVRAAFLPLLFVSITAPLCQRWFASSLHPRAGNPYPLYAASNLGSLLGLLAYPFLIEPRLPLAAQGRLWSVGYGLLMVLLAACGALAARRSASSASVPPAGSSAALLQQRLRWLALSLVPVSLLLGVTAHLGTDIAAVPLLWVLPLALYLLSFILSFLPLPDGFHRFLARLLPLLVLGLVFLGILRQGQSALLLLAHLGAFLVASLVCHGELYRARPPPSHLTVFYIWISIGGALGGLLNAVVAPLLLSRVLEYPLALVAACMLLPAQPKGWWRTGAGLLAPLAVGLLCAALAWASLSLEAQVAALGRALGFDGEGALRSVVYALPLVLCYTLLGSGVRFGIAVGAVILAALVVSDRQNPVLHRERSFFGVMTVQADRRTGVRHLLHGTTLHGKQDPRRPREPLSYYHRKGPMGEIFTARRYEQVAFVGLGPGALVAYGEPGQRFTGYEIDPAVVHIAQDPRLFTYLRDTRAAVHIVIGDARLRLAEAPDSAYDLLVLDAFSSDAIPVHLLTREAFGLYLRKLRPGGVLVLHISNRYFRLEPVVGRLAEEAGLFSLRKEDPGDPSQERDRSDWVALARGAADLGDLVARPGWHRLAPGGHLWTDDFTDLIGVLRWR